MIQETTHPWYGKITYDHRGYPCCHVCGKAFKKVMSHVWQAHGITAKDYKLAYGLNVTKGIIADITREKLQKSVSEHYDLVVARNLIKGGKETRFEKGCKGRTREKISEQCRLDFIQRIREINERRKQKC